MEITRARRTLLHANEDGGRDWDKRLRFSKDNLKRLDLAADFFKGLQRGDFATPQVTRRKQREMGWQMGQVRVQFLTEVGNEFSDCIPDVSHQGITGVVHDQRELYLARLAAPAKRSAIIEVNLHGVGA